MKLFCIQGGLPAWILQNNGSVVVRTMDPGYIKPVDRWMSVLLGKIKPMIYANGGPVIMVQVGRLHQCHVVHSYFFTQWSFTVNKCQVV